MAVDRLVTSRHEPASRKGRRVRTGTLLFALLAQCALLSLTVFIIVLDTPESEPPRFEGKVAARQTQDDLQEMKTRDRFMQRMRRSNPLQRLAVESAALSELPPLPDLPVESFDFSGEDLSLAEEADAMLAQSGLMGSRARGLGSSSAAAFFGVRDTGRRIVIIANTSASVVRKARNQGISIEAIQEEVVSLIESLDSGTLFGIVQFSQGGRRFADQLAPAIQSNKEAVTRWVREELRGNPKISDDGLLGHEAGMKLAVEMNPDLIFLVTDGVLNKRVKTKSGYSYPEIPYELLIGAIEKDLRRLGSRTRIHVIGFEMKEDDRRGMERLTRRFGGSLRTF